MRLVESWEILWLSRIKARGCFRPPVHRLGWQSDISLGILGCKRKASFCHRPGDLVDLSILTFWNRSRCWLLIAAGCWEDIHAARWPFRAFSRVGWAQGRFSVFGL